MSAGPFAPVPTANSAATTSLDATTQRSQVRSGGGGGGWWKVRTKAAPYLFLLPYLLVTAVFFLYPLCYATGLAFYQTSGPKAKTFVGFENFNFVLHDP